MDRFSNRFAQQRIKPAVLMTVAVIDVNTIVVQRRKCRHSMMTSLNGLTIATGNSFHFDTLIFSFKIHFQIFMEKAFFVHFEKQGSIYAE